VNEALDHSPGDLWLRRAKGWVLYDLLKRGLQSIRDDDDTDEERESSVDMESVHRYFAEFSDLQLPREDTLIYSCMLHMAAKAQRAGWKGFVKFVQWWDLERLTEDDRKAGQTNDGQAIPSLEQRVLYALGRAAKQAPPDQREWIFQVLQQKAPDFSEDIWIQRALALLQAELGDQHHAVERFLPLLRRKPREWWMWKELAELLEPIDQEQAILGYFHACSLMPDKAKLVNVYLRLAELLMSQQRYADAAWCAQQAHHHRTRQQWRIPEELAQILNHPQIQRYPNAPEPQVDTQRWAQRLLAPVAPTAIQQADVVVDHHNPEKEITYLLFSPRDGIPLPHRRFPQLKLLREGTIVEVDYYTDEQGRRKVIYCQPTPKHDIEGFVRTVQGTLRKPPDKPFGFIHTDGGKRYFVPPKLAQGLPTEAPVEAVCILKYNEKRAQEDWVALRVDARESN
jgi:tetratricopeptide (TPR) repeat protein